MPVMVGVVKVINISASGVFNIGDVYSICPDSNAKTYAGGGSFNTGDGTQVRLKHSHTRVFDSDKLDQPIALGG